MKTLLTIIILLTLTISGVAQRQISYGYIEIKKVQYDTCRTTAYLIANSKIKKQYGKLVIPVTEKSAKVFKDDNSDENYHEFEYLGDVKGTNLSLVKRIDYNTEEFYLVNRSTGAIDTLIGEPVFARNMRDFACFNIPGTDEKQQVQICELKSGSVRPRAFLNGKPDTLFDNIACINRNFILTKDNQGKYWRLNFKIGDK